MEPQFDLTAEDLAFLVGLKIKIDDLSLEPSFKIEFPQGETVRRSSGSDSFNPQYYKCDQADGFVH